MKAKKNYAAMYQQKKMQWGLLLGLLLLMLVIAYFTSGLFLIEGLTLETIEDGLMKVFAHFWWNWWNEQTPACLGIAFILWLLVISLYITHNRNFQFGIEHGSSTWLDVHEANQDLCDFKHPEQNRIITQNLKIGYDSLPNNNMLVIGSSGLYKTTSVMHQNILQFASTYVVLDVKGDTQRKTGNAFLEAGYKIHSLNLVEPERSDRINLMANVENENDVLRLIKALHSSCRKTENTAADPFWDDAVDLFLGAVFYYEWLEARDEGRVAEFNNIVKLIGFESQMVSVFEKGEEQQITKLEKLINELEVRKKSSQYPPVREYRKLKTGAPETVGSVVLMLNAMFKVCETAEIRRIFEHNDIDVRDLGLGANCDGKTKTVLFLVIPDNNPVYNFIISMFYTQMFDILIRCSDNEIKRPLPLRVEFWLDEFYAGARPADPDVLLGVIRSRNISMIPMVQSVSQIETIFPGKKWVTVLDNLAVAIFLGSGPMAYDTHEYISKVLGNATIDTKTDNLHNGRSLDLNFARQSRALMTPDEVKRLPIEKAIVFLTSRPPIIDYKAIPFDVDVAGYYAPDWLKNRYQYALSLGLYIHPVYAIYDRENLQYLTVNKEVRYRNVTGIEAERLRAAAQGNNRNIHHFVIDENELVYINFTDSKAEIEELKDRLQELSDRGDVQLDKKDEVILLQEFPQEFHDKTDWIVYDEPEQNITTYFEKLSTYEQEEILIAMRNNMPLKDISEMMFLSLVEMHNRRLIWVLNHVN